VLTATTVLDVHHYMILLKVRNYMKVKNLYFSLSAVFDVRAQDNY